MALLRYTHGDSLPYSFHHLVIASTMISEFHPPSPSLYRRFICVDCTTPEDIRTVTHRSMHIAVRDTGLYPPASPANYFRHSTSLPLRTHYIHTPLPSHPAMCDSAPPIPIPACTMNSESSTAGACHPTLRTMKHTLPYLLSVYPAT